MELLIPRIILCLNNIKIVHEDIKIVHVVNFEHHLDFPVVIEEIGNFSVKEEDIGPKPDMYIINSTNVFLGDLLSILNDRLSFNPKAKFVVLDQRMEDNALYSLYYFFVFNVVFIKETDGNIYTYFPFKKEEYPSNNFNLVKIGNLQKYDVKLFFEQKIPNTWEESEFISCFIFAPPYFITHDQGISTEMTKLLFLKTKVTLKWHDDIYTSNGDWAAHFQRILTQGTCDVYMSYLVQKLDLLMPQCFDDGFWFIPRPKKLPKWKYVFRIFSVNVWILWFGIPVVLSLVWTSTLCLQGIRPNMEILIGSIALVLRLFLEQCVKLILELSSQKIIATNMILFTFIMNVFFKSRFSYLLTFGRIFETNTIKSFEDIMRANLQVGIIPIAFSVYSHDPKALEYFKTYHNICRYDGQCLNRTAFKRDMATLIIQKMYVYDKKNLVLIDENGKDLIWRISPSVITYISGGILKRGHPMFDFLHWRMHLLWDHGFVMKVNTKFEDDTKYDQVNFEFEGLDIEQIELSLGLLVIGLLFSAVIFYFELKEDEIH